MLVRPHRIVVATDLRPAAGADAGERSVRHQQRAAVAEAHDFRVHHRTVAADQPAAVADGKNVGQAFRLDQQASDAGDAAETHAAGQGVQPMRKTFGEGGWEGAEHAAVPGPARDVRRNNGPSAVNAG